MPEEWPWSNADLKWEMFSLARENRRFFCLYSIPGLANLVPKGSLLRLQKSKISFVDLDCTAGMPVHQIKCDYKVCGR